LAALGFHVSQHIFLGDAAIEPSASQAREIDLVFVGHFGDDGGDEAEVARWRNSGRNSGRGRRWQGGGGHHNGWGRLPHLARLADQGQHRPHFHRRPCRDQRFEQHPRRRGRDFGIHFVGVDFEERVKLVDSLALAFEPFANGALDNRLAEEGHDDVGGHEESLGNWSVVIGGEQF
jgi:hypothetical protein